MKVIKRFTSIAIEMSKHLCRYILRSLVSSNRQQTCYAKILSFNPFFVYNVS